MYENAESVLARITQEAAQAQQRAEAATRFRQEVDRTQGTAWSRDRNVKVTVDASGLLLDLEIDDAALARRGRDLAADIRRVVHDAQQNAARAVMASATDAFGATSPLTARMQAELDDRFREPETDAPSRLRGVTIS